MTQDIEKLIAEQRAEIERDLSCAIDERDRANEEVKRLRAKLDAAPRLHVKRRSKKARVEAEPCCGEFDTGSGMHGDECEEESL